MYGKSLILRTVSASLAASPHLELISLAPPFPGIRELVALEPDVIIFDRDAAQPEAAFALLQACPHLLLIGIDASTDQMLLWSGQRSRALSMQDLVQAIGAPDGASARPGIHISFSKRVERLVSLWTAFVPTRKQKLVFALAAVTLLACLVVLLAPAGPAGEAPLAGTAVGGTSVELALAFAAGVLLGGLILGLWPRLRRHR